MSTDQNLYGYDYFCNLFAICKHKKKLSSANERAWNCQITISNLSLVTGLQQHNLPCPQPQPHFPHFRQLYSCISLTGDMQHFSKLTDEFAYYFCWQKTRWKIKWSASISQIFTNLCENLSMTGQKKRKNYNNLLYQAATEPAVSGMSVPSLWAFNGSKPGAFKPL